MIDLSKYMVRIQGKDYLPVAPRVVRFREDHPEWTIHTEAVTIAGEPYMRAEVRSNGQVIASAHKHVDPKRRGPGAAYPVESAETGAVGRALALCGYGTIESGDLDEGDELADSPVERAPKEAAPAQWKRPSGRKPKSEQPVGGVSDAAPEADHDLDWDADDVHVRPMCEQAIGKMDLTMLPAIRTALAKLTGAHREGATRWYALARVLVEGVDELTPEQLTVMRGHISGLSDDVLERDMALERIETALTRLKEAK